MKIRDALLIAAFLGGLGGSVSAQDAGWDQAGRALEMRAHTRLMKQVGQTPDPFESDGCSGGLSAAWRMAARGLPAFADTHEDAPPFEDCCVAHDRSYHNAGAAATAEASYAARLDADRLLRACVLEVGEGRRPALSAQYGVNAAQVDAAYETMARAVYYSVRFGGGPCSGLSWRWGFGFAACGRGD